MLSLFVNTSTLIPHEPGCLQAMREEIRFSGKEIAVVGLLYLLATLLMTYPIPFRPGLHYSVHNDYMQGLWNLWWFKESLIGLGRNPYVTDYLFYPNGVSLAFHTLSITNAAMALPLLFVADLVTSYNIVYLLTFLIAGIGTYLLVKDATGSGPAAFLGGIVLAFSPYHFVKSYQIWEASVEWMPLFAFFYFRFLRGGGLREATLSAIMLALASLSSWYLMVFSFLFIAFSLVYLFLTDRKRLLSQDFLRGFAYLAGFFGVLILPFAYPMLRGVILGEAEISTSLYIQFLKGGEGLLAGMSGSTFQVGMTQLQGMRLAMPLFWPGILGYLPILLAAVGLIRSRTIRERGFWIVAALLFYLFLLGPYLTVFDRVYRNIPLPWLLLDRLPIFKAIRYPHRFLAPLSICLAVLSGGGALALSRWIAGWRPFRAWRERVVALLLAGLSALVMVEYAVAPIGHYRVPISPFYETLADDPDDYAILDCPIMTPFTAYYMYYQTTHRKKIPGGQVVYPGEKVIDFLKTTPAIRELANPVLIEERGEPITLPGNTGEILGGLGFRYVLVHVDILRPFRGESPIPKVKLRWNRASLLPPSLNPQRDLLQEIFYFSMRKRTAFEEDHSLDDLLRELESHLGPPIYADDSVVAFEVRDANRGSPGESRGGESSGDRTR